MPFVCMVYSCAGPVKLTMQDSEQNEKSEPKQSCSVYSDEIEVNPKRDFGRHGLIGKAQVNGFFIQ